MKKIIILTAVLALFLFNNAICQEATKKSLSGASKQKTEVQKESKTQKKSFSGAEKKSQDIQKKESGTVKQKFSSTKKKTETKVKKSVVSKVSGRNPIKGKVISLNDYILGGDGTVTKEKAKKLAGKGQLIVFKANGKVYFVYHADGSCASKKLANFANLKHVGIIGKVKKIHGVYVIIADVIESME